MTSHSHGDHSWDTDAVRDSVELFLREWETSRQTLGSGVVTFLQAFFLPQGTGL